MARVGDRWKTTKIKKYPTSRVLFMFFAHFYQ